MDAESLVTVLVRLQLAASAAILVVWLLRPLALRWCGAGTAYWLWLVVPLAALAVLLPAREQVVMVPMALDIPVLQQQIEPGLEVGVMREHVAAAPEVQPVVPDDRSRSGLLIALWLLGAGVFLIRSIVNTRKLASSPSTGPALVGVLRPRLVLPQDFETRFNAEERTLILAHEEMHRVSRHTLVNALVEVVRCAGWFNPLLHWAAMRFRADQELACDTAVITAYPQARRAYAEALLKAQVTGVHLPMGCVWNSGTAGRLGERITRLSEKLPGRRRQFAGAVSIIGIGIAASYAAWAQQPARIVTVQQPNPENAAVVPDVSTPSTSQVPVRPLTAQAPQGALTTALETAPGTPAFNGEHAPYDEKLLQSMTKLADALPGGYTIEDAKMQYAAKHQELWKDPAYRKLVLAEVRPKYEREYPGVAQELGLAEQEAERLFDLMADNAITRMAAIPIPKIILGRPTPDELRERQDVERRTQEVFQASRLGLEESIRSLLGSKYDQWWFYQNKRGQTLRVQQLERGERLEESMRRSLARPLSVTADRAQREARRNLEEGLEQMTASHKKMRMELERDGLLKPLPGE